MTGSRECKAKCEVLTSIETKPYARKVQSRICEVHEPSDTSLILEFQSFVQQEGKSTIIYKVDSFVHQEAPSVSSHNRHKKQKAD